MSRYRGPKLRIIRRLGDLPGLTTKTTERLYPPGQHGPSKANKKSSLSSCNSGKFLDNGLSTIIINLSELNKLLYSSIVKFP